MEEIEMHPFFIYPVVIIISSFLLWSIVSKWWFSKKNSPPSPRKLPIIGNLHQLGSLPHRNLQILAKKHGPLMLLHFGTVPVLIASSAEAAREIMKTHDLNFVNRPVFKSFKKLLYDCKSISVVPYGEYWRKVRSIFVHQLLSNKRVRSYSSIREEETAIFIRKIEESRGKAVNLTRMFSELTVDGICRSALGRKYSDSESGKKFLLSMTDFAELLGAISIGDFIPWLGWINRFNGFDKRVDKVSKELDDFFEGVIQERIEKPSENGENFVDILLKIISSDSSSSADNVSSLIDRDSIKALVLDALIGGTDTVSTVLEWVMTELLRHPNVMENLQKEVREIVVGKQAITDDDVEKMLYLKAVIKESLRYHPPVPLLVPRLADKDVKIMGYDISAGTLVVTNAWAIANDPKSWDEPEKFEPARFLNNKIDYNGLDFEFIPFGAGRRSCPGLSFAVATIEFVVANVVHKFTWRLPDGLQGKYLDITERSGVTVHRRVPLLAVATRSI